MSRSVRIPVLCSFVTVFLLTCGLSWAAAPASSRLEVVASTSLLQSAVREIGGSHVTASVLIAPGSCPGHFDIRPEDIRKLSGSRLVLIHGYETFISNLVSSMGRNKPRLLRVKTEGHWMLPSVYIRGAGEVSRALCAADPRHAADYRKSLSKLERDAKRLDFQLRARLKAARASGVGVLCSDQQKPVAQWMGLKVIGTYSRAEEFTPAKLHSLAALARKHKVKLVIDNLQSGPNAGKELARDIGAAHVTLSNFPGGFAGTDTWARCLSDSVGRVLKGLGQR